MKFNTGRFLNVVVVNFWGLLILVNAFPIKLGDTLMVLCFAINDIKN